MGRLFVGVDDGYSETKIVAGGQSFRIPSQAKAGEVAQIALDGQGDSVHVYKTSDGMFSVGALRESDPTQFDDYPESAMNRVIVHHALRTAGIPGGTELFIASGLPLKKYYQGKEPNKARIRKKESNLLMNDVVALDGTPLARVARHAVLSEAIAAWMDIVLQRNAEGDLVKNLDLYNKSMAIIDIGGRTTDIAVIQSSRLDVSRCATIDVGMLSIKDIIAEQLRQKFDLEPNAEMLNQAVDKGEVRLWGRPQSVADILSEAKNTIAQRIQAECKRRIGNAADIDEVVFVGGTVVELGPLLDGWFKNQRIGDDPEFANARGMQKYAELMLAKS